MYNKFKNVMAFLKAHGIPGLVGKNGWPRYTEEEPGNRLTVLNVTDWSDG